MPESVKFYINNNLVNPPKNWQEMELELNFDKENTPRETVSITDFEFVRENADLLNGIIASGITNGPGIFEGVPLRIEVSRGNQLEKPFDGYIDLTESESFSDNQIETRAKERNKIDWLNDVADGFTFEYLAKTEQIPGAISSADYRYIPYVLSEIPDYKGSAIALLTVYVLEQQILDVIEKVKELIPSLANPFAAISTVLQAAFLIAYIATLIIAIVKQIKAAIALLIQPVKYHACMYVKTLMQKGCAHLGLTFQSSIFDPGSPFEKAVIMPEKFNNPVNTTDNRLLGFIQPNNSQQDGYFKGTFGDLLRAAKTIFNAKVVITDNGTLVFERRDRNITNAQYTIPPIYNPFYSYNTSECKANWYGTFQTDTIDKNTLQEYTGTAYQVILRPDRVTNSDLTLMKGLEEIRIPFALAKRKTELTVVEQIIKTFLDVLSSIVNVLISAVNSLISALNAIIDAINDVIDALGVIGIHINFQVGNITPLSFTNLGNLIENRVGMLKLETDFTSVPKLFLLQEGSQPKYNKIKSGNLGNELVVTAQYIYNNFHIINSFLPSTDNPNGNQYIRPQVFTVGQFGIDEYLKVKNNNQVLTSDGRNALIESLKWNPFNQSAEIQCRISQLYTNNFVQTILIPNGR